jgi:N-methylhydantoinase A/oxoprolinase/acetone carboxylase beta subunit
MLLGIDVGGTFTDAVVLDHGALVAKVKSPTTHENLLDGLLAALDAALLGVDKHKLTRVALSTTIVTNALVEGKTDQVGLLLMPGPGMDYRALLPTEPQFLSGYIDHRGREVAAPQAEEVAAACRKAGKTVYAVAGKFSVRNPVHEQQVANCIGTIAAPLHISLSSRVSGTLNFWRRANSAYYNAAVWRRFGAFADAVDEALKQRGIAAPVYILKADGGTMPLQAARSQPVEAIFTGPAASVLGIMAMVKPEGQIVSLDIGGTTTDIALWRNGLPLFTQYGARVAGFPTSIQAFRLKSIGLGGDSYVRKEAGTIRIGPERKGPAMAVGGTVPTLSDAMIAAGLSHFGDKTKADYAMQSLELPGASIQETAMAVLNQAVDQLTRAIAEMIDEQAAEPVYRVDDIINQTPLNLECIIGIGGAAHGLVPLAASRLGIRYDIPRWAEVANAVGAAAAKPTVEVTLRADTSQGYYTVAELGLKEKLPGRSLRVEQARELAAEYLRVRVERSGAIDTEDIDILYEEDFNVIRGFSTIGKIITCRVQLKPGVLSELQGGEAK